MKPIFIDTHLDLHDKMLNEMSKSLKKVKRRLHKVELTMYLIPPDNEPVEMHMWKSKVDNLISLEKVFISLSIFNNLYSVMLSILP